MCADTYLHIHGLIQFMLIQSHSRRYLYNSSTLSKGHYSTTLLYSHALCCECLSGLLIEEESCCQTHPLLRRSPCLRHTSWSSVSSRASIPTQRTSTWRCSTHAVMPGPRPCSLPTFCAEDAQKNDNTVPNHGDVVIHRQSEARC